MTGRCIACAKFTAKPREAQGGFNEWLREQDRKMVALGLGRCLLTKESYRWHPAEAERECPSFEAIADDQVQKRRDFMASRRQ